MKNQSRREFIKISGKTLLVTSGISVFGLSNLTAKPNEGEGNPADFTDAYFTDGYYDDGYYFDGYYNDGYYNDGYYNDGYTTGINSYKPESLDMGVFPNPSNGNFQLQLTAKVTGPAEIFITDLIGRTMLRESKQLVTGTNNIQFNAEQLAKGTYYISVITVKGTGSIRLVIAK